MTYLKSKIFFWFFHSFWCLEGGGGEPPPTLIGLMDKWVKINNSEPVRQFQCYQCKHQIMSIMNIFDTNNLTSNSSKEFN